MNNNLPFSPRLTILWKQSYLEAGVPESGIPDPHEKPGICLYPKSYVDQTHSLGSEKIFDYNFRGAVYIDRKTRKNRRWVVDFAKQHFTADSYFQITDRKAKHSTWFSKARHESLGGFDRTFTDAGFVPKENARHTRGYFDEEYFRVLCQSKFTLCPAGDAPWSMRFFESILSKSIPIVEKTQHAGRNKLEYGIGYNYYLLGDEIKTYRPDWVEENFKKFVRFQTLG